MLIAKSDCKFNHSCFSFFQLLFVHILFSFISKTFLFLTRNYSVLYK